eukprot:CAMPEP_0185541454 /NCGR_PEP_ID=MMETSP1381-20130426/1972_1 /TAXON_ID=298111 /ORGANISM="Pavlova sp., Strain CCMP459" /LENGTH=74 /DNA_ID=CAMNT_0028153363 /DNA_START=129 /DNA_END=349 /DNA_ORIENTATION=+
MTIPGSRSDDPVHRTAADSSRPRPFPPPRARHVGIISSSSASQQASGGQGSQRGPSMWQRAQKRWSALVAAPRS